jgi:hypothetical protein
VGGTDALKKLFNTFAWYIRILTVDYTTFHWNFFKFHSEVYKEHHDYCPDLIDYILDRCQYGYYDLDELVRIFNYCNVNDYNRLNTLDGVMQELLREIETFNSEINNEESTDEENDFSGWGSSLNNYTNSTEPHIEISQEVEENDCYFDVYLKK